MSTEPDFELPEHDDDGVRVVRVLGALDLRTAPLLRARLDELQEAGRVTRVDLSETFFADSSGVGALIAAKRAARATGWPLRIGTSVSASVATIVGLMNLDGVLWPTGDDA